MAVDEVRRSVDRIDVEDGLRARIRSLVAALLADDREQAVEPAPEDRLRLAVEVGDEIDRALVLDQGRMAVASVGVGHCLTDGFADAAEDTVEAGARA